MKTVYILGAGFSRDAGAPTQSEIMQEAFRFHAEDPTNFDRRRFNEFTNFLKKQLHFSKKKYSSIELEDIFTPLDRCLTNSSQFRGIGLDKIMKVRESVFYVVGRTIHLVLEQTDKSKQYINDFADYLTNTSSLRGIRNRGHDPVSVISTNWDILLDNSIYQSLQQNHLNNGVVDYCCYINSVEENDPTVISGLEKLGQGGFNVKLLKLHGSLNWLQCPRCARLYTRFNRKEAIYNFENPSSCRHCDTNFSEEVGNHKLTSNLIMPTYLKDLSNPQYRIIWQNAGIEISEASNIVFIGYSLRGADFEMRQLLSRMARRDAKVFVVECISEDDTEKRNHRKQHWKKFFGRRVLKINFDGASSYIDNLVDEAGETNWETVN